MRKINALSRKIALFLAIVVMAGVGFAGNSVSAETGSDSDSKTPTNCLVAPCYVATITSPEKGETWKTGSKYKIVWENYSEYGDTAYIRLNLYNRDNVMDPTVHYIAGPVKNNGLYVWTVPETIDNVFLDKKVEISIYFPSLGRSENSDPFLISRSETSKPLTVTSPKAGSIYGYNSKNVVHIKWAPSNSRGKIAPLTNYVAITLSPDWTCVGGPAVTCPAPDIAPYTITERARNNGEYKWEIPADLSAMFKDRDVKINVYVNSTGKSASSGAFKIASAPQSTSDIVVSSPKAGSEYGYKQKVPIKWEYSTDDLNFDRFVKISLVSSVDCLDAPTSTAQDTVISCDRPTPAPYVIKKRTRNTGSFTWKIPKDLDSIYFGKVKILVEGFSSNASGLSGEFTISDKSTNTLTISPESMPAGMANQNYEQYFTASGGTAPYYWSASITQSRVTYSMNETTGRFFASPTTPGLWRVNVNVKDSAGHSTSKLYSWQVGAQPVDVHPEGSIILGSETDPTSVFLITKKDGTLGRMAFPNEPVFMSHGYKWNKLVPSSLQDQQLPILGGIRFAPGSLIKPNQGADFQASRTIYLVVDEKTIRPFATYDVFIKMGYRADMVWSVNTGILSSYEVGEAIFNVERHADGTDVMDTNGRIFYIDNGKLRDYESIAAFNSWHTFDNDFSRVILMNELDKNLPISSPIGVRYYPN